MPAPDTRLAANPWPPRPAWADHDRLTRSLLVAGVASGPVFLGAALLQGLLRPGFDLIRQPISFLSLGDLGWIQITNFLLSGLLVACFAAGVRRRWRGSRGGILTPAGLCGLGVGVIVAGLFPPDAGFGFPPGTPPGAPAHLTSHSALHGLGFSMSFLFFVVAAIGVVRRDLAGRRHGPAAYTALSSLVGFALAVTPGSRGVAVRDLLAAFLVWTWLTVQATRAITANGDRIGAAPPNPKPADMSTDLQKGQIGHA